MLGAALLGCGDGAPSAPRHTEVDVAIDVVPELEATEDVVPELEATEDVVPELEATEDVVPELEATEDVVPELEVTEDVMPELEVTEDVMPEVEVADPCAPLTGLAVPTPTDLATLAPTMPGTVRGVWISPSDRPFPPGLHERLDAWLALTNDFFADELARWTGSARRFVPQRGADGRWDVVYLRGEHDLAFYHTHANSPDAGGEALAEIFARLPAAFHRDAIIVYFYDTALVSGPGLAHTGQGGSAAPWQGDHAGYALIGAHVLGVGFDTIRIDSANQACAFDDTTATGLEDYDGLGVWRALDRGEWASTFVGASIHELGHAFGLEHVFDDLDLDGVENNLMGNGFRRFGGRFSDRLPQPPTLLGPTSAAPLAAHPFFGP